MPEPADYGDALLRLLGSPNMSSRRWVWEQYDHLVQGNTTQRPGGDAAVVRIPGTPKALAFSSDVTPRYCAADPFEGGKQAIAECWRNLTAVGSLPLAVTDNLNFGNPERPVVMGQFAAAILGIGEACRALDFPVVSGNVSLYNETDGASIPPTPTIGGVGLLADASVMTTLAFKNEGDMILLIGNPGAHLGRSAYLAEVLGRDEGTPPPVDLRVEKVAGDFVRSQIVARMLTAVHDISDGGLAVALAEMAMAGKLGATFTIPSGAPKLGCLFGEDQARYVLTVRPADADGVAAAAKSAGVPISRIGAVGGDELICSAVFGIRLAKLKAAYENWFPAFMSRPA